MKTGLISGLALGACASVALAEPASTVVDTKDAAVAAAHAAGPVALTEAEMDKVTAGVSLNFTKITYNDITPPNTRKGELDLLAWSWGASRQ